MGSARRVWDEAKHPRGPGGKFASHGSGVHKAAGKAAHTARQVDWVQPHSRGGVDWAQPTRAASGKAPSINPRGRTAPHAPSPSSNGVAWTQPHVDWVQPKKAPSINPRGRTAPHAPAPSGGVAWAQPNVDWVQPKSASKATKKAAPKRSKAPKAPAPSGGVAWVQPGVGWVQPKTRTARSMMR